MDYKTELYYNTEIDGYSNNFWHIIGDDKSSHKHIGKIVFKTFLTKSDINLIKIAFPNYDGFTYEECTQLYADFTDTKILTLPKNITFNYLFIRKSHIKHLDPTIKVETLIADPQQLFHIPFHANFLYFNNSIVKDFNYEYEKLMKIGRDAYYKEISDICEKLRNE